MIYQKMIVGNAPFFLAVGNICKSGFDLHRHHELELSFCIAGTYDIFCQNKRYTLSEGDLAIIPPIASHGIPSQNRPEAKAVTIEVGYAFLGDYYDFFVNQIKKCHIIRKSEFCDNVVFSQLSDCIQNTIVLKTENNAINELLIKSNLYKISALILRLLEKTNEMVFQGNKMDNVQKVDKALEIIYNQYNKSLNIETVSVLCGYSKGHFCRVFKKITGGTFHSILNRHRTEIACELLRDENLSVEEISSECGFTDSKSFCRTFKNIMNMSPGTYRKKKYRT